MCSRSEIHKRLYYIHLQNKLIEAYSCVNKPFQDSDVHVHCANGVFLYGFI